MIDRLHRLTLALWVGTLAAAAMAAQDPGTAPAYPAGQPTEAPSPPAVVPAELEPIGQWLDEVRAQRRAWEERRQAAKEAIDARRRWLDPWGATQHEAREQETERRREAFREQIQRDREAFRNQGPWGAPFAPWNEEPGTPGSETPSAPAAGTGGTRPQDDTPAPPYPPLPGWDNRWYYHGY